MILISLSIALIAMVFGAKLLAQSKKDGLGSFYKVISWFVLIMGFLIVICDGTRSLCSMCPMHRDMMMHRECMMMERGNGNCDMMMDCHRGNMCHDGMMNCDGNSNCPMHGGSCDGMMNCPDSKNSSCSDGGMGKCPMGGDMKCKMDSAKKK